MSLFYLEDGMNIPVEVGKETWHICGSEKCYELGRWHKSTNKKTGETTDLFSATYFCSSLESLMGRLLGMKIRASDADSLLALQQEIKKAKEYLAGIYS